MRRVQAAHASVLTSALQVFVEFKQWMAEQAVQRPEPKRRRDRRQAAIVHAMLDEGMLLA